MFGVNAGIIFKVFWILINARFGSLPRPPKVFDFGRSTNAIKTHDKLRKPSTVDLQNDENWTRSNEIASFLKTWFPRPPKVSNFDRSRNAIKTDEKVRTHSNADLHHDEISNIPHVLTVFLIPLNAHSGSLPRLPEIPTFGRSRNAIKTDEKLRKPSNVDLQHVQHVNIP